MKKKLMALGMAAVLAFGAAGCGGGTDAKTDDTALEDFNIVLDWYPNAIHSFLYVAQEKGYFAARRISGFTICRMQSRRQWRRMFPLFLSVQ